MQEYLQQLNQAQLAPTIQKDGAMIVIAGAGSGKTRVLTYRIAFLMSKGVDPFNILALTFTNKAAREMKKRISTIVGPVKARIYGWEPFIVFLLRYFVWKPVSLVTLKFHYL